MIPSLPDPATLPPDFLAQRLVVVPEFLAEAQIARWHRRALEMSKSARSVSRREPGKDHGTDLVYRVVTGEQIRTQWPELFDLYNSEALREWIKAITGEARIFVSAHLQSGLNLNVMEGVGSVYRWHFDAVPYTALVYLTDVDPDDGGALEVIRCREAGQEPAVSESEILRIWPKAGMLILMDGTRCYHRVAPILRPALRFSIPMVFPREAAERPVGLDSYLYDTAA